MNTSKSRKLCTFKVDRMVFGVEVERVQEIIRHQAMTPVPLSHANVRGLMNLRGQIVTALDLRGRLALPPAPPEHLPVNVVINTNEGSVSLLVDEIGDVMELNETLFEPPPNTLKGVTKELIRGAYKLEKGLLLLMDLDATLRLI
ncbi:MAG: chemotaxis protein CheW [Pirellulaceae bacterium]